MAEQNGSRKRTALLVAGGLLAGGAAAGVIGVTAATASGAPGLTSAVSSESPQPGTGRTGEGGRGGFPSGSHGAGETVVTGSKAATLTAAALEAVPGGTVLRVETDSGGAAYEVHMKKSDGTLVTVKLDASLAVTGVEDGMGTGGPGGHGPQGGGTPGQAPSDSPESGSAT